MLSTPKLLEPLVLQAQRILADPKLQSVHEATRASLRIAQYQLAPLERLYALSEQLQNVSKDPYRDSALGDWILLVNHC